MKRSALLCFNKGQRKPVRIEKLIGATDNLKIKKACGKVRIDAEMVKYLKERRKKCMLTLTMKNGRLIHYQKIEKRICY